MPGLVSRSKLYLVHVAESNNHDWQDGFPHVRDTLSQWHLVNAGDPPAAVYEKLGIKVAKIGLKRQDPLPCCAFSTGIRAISSSSPPTVATA
jgi:hypothetical protein